MERLLRSSSVGVSQPRADRPAQVLVAVDGSDQALAACLAAVEIAACFGAGVTVLHVAVPQPRSALISSAAAARHAEARARANGEAVLDAARAGARPGLSITTELIFGDPADVICRRADDLEVDLVVVGSRGLGTLHRLLLGSVSQAVVSRSRRSVLVVRPDESSDVPGSA